MKKEILDRIDNIIDYQETERIKLNVYVTEVAEDAGEYLLFSDNLYLKTANNDEMISYKEIKEINLSMCSRLYNPGVVESNIGKWIVKRWQRGAPLTVGQHVNYYLDLDIVLKNQILKFENNNLYDVLKLIECLEKNDIIVNDPLKIKEILIKYPDPVDLVRYLNNHFPKLAKRYDLDNPRGAEFIK